MKSIIAAAIALIFAQNSYAAPPVTHQFTNGSTIEAAQMNSNFQELADRIEVVDNRAAVTTNSSEIAALKSLVSSLQSQVESLQNLNSRVLVGYTSIDYPGDQSRHYLKLNSQCDLDFPGSRLCSTTELSNSNNINPVPAAGAWVKPRYTSIAASVPYTSIDEMAGELKNYSCVHLTSAGILQVSEDIFSSGCTLKVLPAACCR